MNHDYDQTPFSKSVLAGVFAGILATCLILIYNFIYRGSTAFPLSEIINVSTVIFASIIILTIAGIIYYFFINNMKAGKTVYIILFSIITLLAAFASMQVHRSGVKILNYEFHQLLLGTVLILGLCAVVGIPLLYKSKQI